MAFQVHETEDDVIATRVVVEGGRLVEIDPGLVGLADLEDQRLDLRERPVAREGGVRAGGGRAGAVGIALQARGLIAHAGGRIGGAVSLRSGGTSLAVQHHRTSFSAARISCDSEPLRM